ncbi:MAG: DUF3854 domain-containing protein [Spirulina sp. SIO3F2]|nr:DUF3854 domain-containing protein [Spirulina sp. SIO3F2]
MSNPSFTAELTASAIDPAFIGTAVTLSADLEIDPYAHEVLGSPLDDALNRRYTRFGHSHKPNEYGFIFHNEDGTEWQVKRDLGQTRDDQRSGQYLAPKEAGNAIYTPPIPAAILTRICQRHGFDPILTAGEVNKVGGFWPWFLKTDLPLIITEGAKKALAALSQGHIAIAFYGCACGKSDALQPFLEGRESFVAFDADNKLTAKRAVTKGIRILGIATQRAKGTLHIVQWHPDEGKGLDDFIAQTGAAAFDNAIRQAMPFSAWDALRQLGKPLGEYKPNLRVNIPCLSKIHPESIPQTGLVIISSGLGTGKTKFIKGSVAQLERVISLLHRISLGRGQSTVLGLDYIGDADQVEGYRGFIGANGLPTTRIGLCWDSLLKVPLADFPPGEYDLVLDEADQGLKHWLIGATCGKNGIRPGLIKRGIALIQNARRVIVASGTLTQAEIDFLATLRSEAPFIIQNDYQGNCYPVTVYTGTPGVDGSASRARGAVISEFMTRISQGQRGAIATDQRAICKILEIMGDALGLDPSQILRIDQDTSGNERQQEFLSAADKIRWLIEHDIGLLIYSPSMTSGVSIEGRYFQFVGGIFEGKTISPQDALQQLARVRDNVPRIIYAAAKGMRDSIGATYASAYRDQTESRTHLFERVTGRTIPTDENYDPIKNYIYTVKAQRNQAMTHFGVYLRTELELAGHTVTMGNPDLTLAVEDARQLWSDWRSEIKRRDRLDILNAPIISSDQAKALEDQQRLTHAESLQLKRYKLCDDYLIHPEALTLEDIEQDRNGRMRRCIARLENLCYDGLARAKDTKQWDKQMSHKFPPLPHDLPRAELSTKGVINAQLDKLLMQTAESTENGDRWHKDTAWACQWSDWLKQYRDHIYQATGLNIGLDWSPVQVIGQVLAHFGLKTTSIRGTIQGVRVRIYHLDMEHLEWLKSLLQRRASRLLADGYQRRAIPLSDLLLEGAAAAEPIQRTESIMDAFCEEQGVEEKNDYVQMDLCQYDSAVSAAYHGEYSLRTG